MQITKQIKIDMANRHLTEPVYAVQGDSNTRVVVAKLFENNIPWEVPGEATAAVAFSKPDGKKGLYDQLPDETNAVTIDANVATAILAPEVLTCAGVVSVSIVFYNEKMEPLSTFPFMVVVEKNPAAGEQLSNNYYYLQNMEQVNTAYKELLERSVQTVNGVSADENGNIQFDWVARQIENTVTILEETTVSAGFHSNLKYEEFEGQEEVAILFDGKLYLSVPEFGYAEGDGYFIYVGNKSLVGGVDTGEPFLIWGYKGASLILKFKESGSHTMSITGSVYTYDQMPEEYLPSGLVKRVNGVTPDENGNVEISVPDSGQNADEIVREVSSIWSTYNLLEDAEWELGYYTSDGGKVGAASAGNQEILSSKITVEPGKTYHVVYSVPAAQASNMWYRYIWYTADGAFISANCGGVVGTVDGDRAYYTVAILAPDNAYGFAVSCRSFCDNGQWWADTIMAKDPAGFNAIAAGFAKRTMRLCADGQESRDDSNVRIFPEFDTSDVGKEMRATEHGWNLRYPDSVYSNSNIRAVNHRGYNTVAPENTLAAFRLSKKIGFEYVETDIRLTSDGVPVLCHNDTVDSTSNGTGAISEMTLAQLKALDFGSWKSDKYAGEKIPTFEEFIFLCKRLGLKPYLEIKAECFPTEETTKLLTDIVERYGMRNNVTWISYGLGVLTRIKEKYPYGRIGLIVDVIDDTAITNVTSLKADTNDVFLSSHYTSVTESNASLCVAANVPLEVWTVNTYNTLLSLDPYVSGFTSDFIPANVAFADSVL